MHKSIYKIIYFLSSMRIYISINGFKVKTPPIFAGKFNLSMIFICSTAIHPCFQKSAYYGSSIKMFNRVPASLKMVMKRIILKQP